MAAYKTIEEIKDFIKTEILIERLELEDITAADITDDMILFSEEGLGLDSVEALDIIAGIEQIFQISLEGMSEEEFREILVSVETLAQFLLNSLASKQG